MMEICRCPGTKESPHHDHAVSLMKVFKPGRGRFVLGRLEILPIQLSCPFASDDCFAFLLSSYPSDVKSAISNWSATCFRRPGAGFGGANQRGLSRFGHHCL